MRPNSFREPSWRWPAAALALILLLAACAPQGGPGSAAPGLAYRWEAGREAAYRLRLSMAAAGGGGGEALRAGGRLHLVVLSVGEESVWLGGQLAEPEFAAGGERVPAVETLLAAAPVLLQYSRRGLLLNTVQPEDLPREDRDLLLGMFAIQAATPPAAESAAWNESETDAQGLSKVAYTVEGGDLVKRRRERVPTAAEGARAQIVESKGTARLGDFWLQSYAEREVFDLIFQGQPMGRLQTTADLERAPDAPLPPELARLKAAGSLADAMKLVRGLRVAGSSKAAGTSVAQGAAADQPSNSPFNQAPLLVLLGHAREVLGRDAPTDERAALQMAMRDWIKAAPGRENEILDALRQGNLPEEEIALLVHGLELAASPGAQSALAQILAQPDAFQQYTVAHAAVSAGGLGNQITSELKGQLWRSALDVDTADPFRLEVADTALLSLGIIGEQNPAVRQEVAAQLGPTLTTDETVDARDLSSALLALGNARVDDAALQERARSLAAGHGEAAVRVAAQQYLHQTGAPDTDLARGLGDADPVVAQQTARLLGDRPALSPEAVGTLTRTVTNGAAEEAVRTAAANALRRQADRDPSLEATLQALAGQVSSPVVRAAVTGENRSGPDGEPYVPPPPGP